MSETGRIALGGVLVGADWSWEYILKEGRMAFCNKQSNELFCQLEIGSRNLGEKVSGDVAWADRKITVIRIH